MGHPRCYFFLILAQLCCQSLAAISWENVGRDAQMHRQIRYSKSVHWLSLLKSNHQQFSYSIISMRITEGGQWRLVRQLEEGRLNRFRVDVLRKVPRSLAQNGKRRSAVEMAGDVDMMIAPEHKDALRKLLKQRKIKHYVTAEDVEE
jgi:Carboxypeptidase activation peptide